MQRQAENHHAGQGAVAVAVAEPQGRLELLDSLKRCYQGQQHLRRGVCLLNAGQYDQAASAFAAAEVANPGGRSLPSLMAACHVGKGDFARAAGALAGTVASAPDEVTARVRQALLFWRADRRSEAVESLRDGLKLNPDSAELHFQLGNMLAALDQTDEAELRFTQAVAIDRNHAEALLALGLCAATRQQPAEAKRYLERAQRRRPHDGRIGLLLSQAAKALADQGQPMQLEAEMPPDKPPQDEQALEQLSRIIEAEPEFVDAFLELPSADQASEMDREVYAVLAETLNLALDRSPKLPALHCAAGRLFDHLGRSEEAVAATERAVDLDPGYAQALLQLARLYQQTDRHQDALVRLEQALRAGARYADVYYMLGNLYRRNGWLEQARWAYVQALELNDDYEAARRALATLAA